MFIYNYANLSYIESEYIYLLKHDYLYAFNRLLNNKINLNSGNNFWAIYLL